VVFGSPDWPSGDFFGWISTGALTLNQYVFRGGENVEEKFTLGDFVLMEIALAQFFKELDISMEAGAQVQGLIGKIELAIGAIKTVAGAKAAPDPVSNALGGPTA